MTHAYLRLLCVWITALLLAGCDRDKAQHSNAPKTGHATDPADPAQSQSTPNAKSSGNNDTKEAPKRSPKRHVPPLTIPSEKIYPVGERLNKELLSIDPSKPAFPAKLTQLWSESAAQIPDAKLASASDSSIAKGLALPKEFSMARKLDITTDNPAAMLDALGFLALDYSGLLPEFAKKRANVLPPSGIDLAIFDALNNALDELGPTRLGSPFEPWEQLASATNPVYRLLGLRAAMHTTSRAAVAMSPEDPNQTRVDARAKLGFYLRYLNEIDPTILREAIAAIATVPTPEARQAIEKFQATQEQRGDAALIQAASDALRTQELITQGLR